MLDEALDLIIRVWSGEPVRGKALFLPLRRRRVATAIRAGGVPSCSGSATEDSDLGRRNLAAQGAILSGCALGRHGAHV